jgi:hypothetical protein
MRFNEGMTTRRNFVAWVAGVIPLTRFGAVAAAPADPILQVAKSESRQPRVGSYWSFWVRIEETKAIAFESVGALSEHFWWDANVSFQAGFGKPENAVECGAFPHRVRKDEHFGGVSCRIRSLKSGDLNESIEYCLSLRERAEAHLVEYWKNRDGYEPFGNFSDCDPELAAGYSGETDVLNSPLDFSGGNGNWTKWRRGLRPAKAHISKSWKTENWAWNGIRLQDGKWTLMPYVPPIAV